jgi:addiction module HigA family antidote
MSKSSTTIKGAGTPNRVTTHPGEILGEEFLEPLGMSANALAMALRVPATRIGAIVKGKRSVTADTALRLARFFGTSPEFWISLQATHDLTKARAERGAAIERDVRPRAA